MNKINVSVIIPVYGVEKYIEKCARSLFEQTLQDGIEYIFVDDCSSDSSVDLLHNIMEEYPNRVNQVKIIRHEENKGLAVARVTGLKAASGEYVIHCDSDDWVDSRMYELLYEEAKKTKADIVGCDYYQELPKEKKERKQAFSLPQQVLLTELIRGNNVEAYLWNRLVKRDFYITHGFRAEPGITFLEDMAVTVPMHLNTDKIGYVSLPLYHYRYTNQNSMSQSNSDRNVRSAIKVLDKLLSLEMPDMYRTEIEQRIKFFLFARILAPSIRDCDSWLKFEYPYLNSHPFSLTTLEKVSVSLVRNKLFFLQYPLVLLNKLGLIMERILAR